MGVLKLPFLLYIWCKNYLDSILVRYEFPQFAIESSTGFKLQPVSVSEYSTRV